MKRTRISDLIEYIEPFDNGRQMVCSGLLLHTAPRMVIDANFGTDDTINFLKDVRPDVAMVTHFHIDHASFFYHVARHTDAEIFVPAGEEAYLKDSDNYCRLIAPAPADEALRLALEQRMHRSGYGEFDPAACLTYDHTTDFGLAHPDVMRVVPTPGHSPGHHSFYFPQEKTLFSGDIGLDDFGPWYAFPNSDIVDFIDSLMHLMTLDIDRVLTSHNGLLSGDIRSDLIGCIRRICELESMIVRKLEQGRSLQQIVEEGVIFGHRKSRRPEPLRSIHYRGDTVVLHHHLRVLREGGIRHFFPDIDSVIG